MEFTFFKKKYLQYTHFTTENLAQTADTRDLLWGNEIDITIDKNGDMIQNLFICIEIENSYILNESVDDLYDTVYIKKDVENVVLLNENLINTYINKIVVLNDNSYNDLIDTLNLNEVFEIVKNKKANNITYDYTFSINLEIVANVYNNEFANTDNLVTNFTINDFDFDSWQLFKLFHLFSYIEKINELDIIKQSNNMKLNEYNDLEIHKLIIKHNMIYWKPTLFLNIIRRYELFIGGNKISSYDNVFLQIYSTLLTKFNTIKFEYINNTFSKIYVPLLFFMDNAFPMLSIKYQDIVLKLQLNDLDNLCSYPPNNTPYISNITLYTTYIHLNNNERNLFLQTSFTIIINDYELIESDITNVDFKITNIDFSNPSKSLYWVIYNESKREIVYNEDVTYEIFINNEKIGSNLDSTYFNTVDKWKTHQTSINNYIYSYSFSINPHQYQPSGYLDFKSMKSKYLTSIIKNKIKNNLVLYLYSLSSRLLKISNGFCVSLS